MRSSAPSAMTGAASLRISLLHRAAVLGGERHADQAAHRGAEPVHRLDVEPRDQRDHVGDVLRPGVELRVGEPVGVAAPGDVGADDAELRAQRARQLVEIARRAREAVHADQHVAVARVAPLPIRHAVQARRPRRTAPSGGAVLYLFSHCSTMAARARHAPGRPAWNSAPPRAAQQGELVRFQVRAAHREAVVRIAHALERGFFLVVPDPFVDEAERRFLERRVGRLGIEQLERVAAKAEIGMPLVGHRVADQAAVVRLGAGHGRARAGRRRRP